VSLTAANTNLMFSVSKQRKEKVISWICKFILGELTAHSFHSRHLTDYIEFLLRHFEKQILYNINKLFISIAVIPEFLLAGLAQIELL